MSLKSAHTAKIGKAFINARRLRSMSQEEAASAALININFIKAIESGDYTIFPARVFAVKYFEKYSNNEDTPILDVVKAANEANVKHLVFYHHLPAPRNQLMEDIMYRGVDEIMENWTASHDGTMLVLPINTDEIIVTSIE